MPPCGKLGKAGHGLGQSAVERKRPLVIIPAILLTPRETAGAAEPRPFLRAHGGRLFLSTRPGHHGSELMPFDLRPVHGANGGPFRLADRPPPWPRPGIGIPGI